MATVLTSVPLRFMRSAMTRMAGPRRVPAARHPFRSLARSAVLRGVKFTW